MKRTLLALCFGSLLATALAQPRITFDEKEHDFGVVLPRNTPENLWPPTIRVSSR